MMKSAFKFFVYIETKMLVWCVVLVVVVAAACYKSGSFMEAFTAVTKREFAEKAGASGYFARMNDIDIRVRGGGAKTREEYKSAYISSWEAFHPQQEQWLKYLCERVAVFVKGTFLEGTPVRFAKLSRGTENDYPHTLQDMILVTDKFFERVERDHIATIIHEMVHVYQRNYPEECEILYNAWGFEKIEGGSKRPLRNNPDVEDVYAIGGKAFGRVYDDDAKDLRDSKIVFLSSGEVVTGFSGALFNPEHPNEIMAELVPKVLMGDADDTVLRRWMETTRPS